MGVSVKMGGAGEVASVKRDQGLHSPFQQTPTDLLAKHGQAVCSSGKTYLRKGRAPQGEEEGIKL